MAAKHDIRHVITDAPRVMVVDGSRLVRKLIGDMLLAETPGARIISCGDLAEARAALAQQSVDLVSTALVLPDGDGLTLAKMVRESAGQNYVPIIVVSGDVQNRLEARTLGEDVTDYFDKSLGPKALAAFLRGYLHPEPIPGGRVLYVEDSKVVALSTKRMLAAQGLEITHLTSVEDALDYLHDRYPADAESGPPDEQADVGTDLVLTDVYLVGALSGRDLLSQIRNAFRYGKRRLPVIVMTGDDNPAKQAELLREGANDLVLKPTEERLLLTKVLFQLRAAARAPQTAAAVDSPASP